MNNVPVQTNNNQGFLQKHPLINGFMKSTYVTVFTDWFTTFGAKSAHFVLIVTLLYTSAELFPGVKLPANVSFAVFILQMVALDLGGIGLKEMARQAMKDGNVEPAENALKLGDVLIKIMLAGIIVASLKQLISSLVLPAEVMNIAQGLETLVELVLLIARAYCAVNYGFTIHALKFEGNHLVETLQETIGNQGRQLETLEETNRNLEAEKVSLEGNLNTAKVSLEETIKERDGFLAQVTEKDTTIGNLSTNIEELRTGQETIRTEMQGTIDGLQAEIESIQAQKASIQGTMERLRGNLSRQQARTPMVPIEDTKVTQMREPKVTQIRTPRVTRVLDEDTQDADKETISIDNGDGVTMTFTGSTKDRIKAAMLAALQNDKEIIYKNIAEVAGTSEKYVKKLGPALKKELGIGDRNTDEMPVITIVDAESIAVGE